MQHSWEDIATDADTATPDDAVMAANVMRLRKARGMNQTALADAMRAAGQGHWRQTTVSRVELGKQRLTGGEVMALQKILGNEVIDGTAMDTLMKVSYPRVREDAARRALAEAEQALAHALQTVQQLRALYTDDNQEG